MFAAIGAYLARAVAPYIARAAFSLLISALAKMGVLNSIESAGARAEHAFIGTIAHLKKYSQPSDFPQGRNGGATP